MEILIKSEDTELLRTLVDALRGAIYLEGSLQDCYLGKNEIDVNEENKDQIIINIK